MPQKQKIEFTEEQWRATLAQHNHWATNARRRTNAVRVAFQKLDKELAEKIEREDEDALQQIDDLWSAYEWLEKCADTAEQALRRIVLAYREAKRNGIKK